MPSYLRYCPHCTNYTYIEKYHFDDENDAKVLYITGRCLTCTYQYLATIYDENEVQKWEEELAWE